MVKILFMIHDLSVGGAEKVLVNLVNNMDKNRFDVTVISLFGGGVNEQFLNESIRYKAIFAKSFRGNSKLMKILSPEKLHTLFVKETYDIEVSYLEGPSARIISGCPEKATKLVSWIHVEQHTKKNASQSFRSYSEALKCYARFNKTICVSDYVKKDFSSIFPSLSNIDVLYNTNETEKIIQMKEEQIQDVLFSSTEIKICGVGKIVPNKGFDRLARIHRRLRENGFPVHTYILGKGNQQAAIQKYLDQNGMSDTFTFLGYQTNPYKYIAKCDLFVCSSLAEGFSTAATEALIVGIPICTVDVSGMREMLGEYNEYGIVVKNDEDALYGAIVRMISDEKIFKHYKKQAILRGKEFTTQRTVEKVESVLIEL